ncbi:receptor-like protein EIX1 [Glycine soja]|uniref:receptor-like protein EIX1 n=1 Tax=Glycine soja TaxID=3848 RepID=UPI00103FED24|nr:receptor-like protein EIX1 [Glycine soja]
MVKSSSRRLLRLMRYRRRLGSTVEKLDSFHQSLCLFVMITTRMPNMNPVRLKFMQAIIIFMMLQVVVSAQDQIMCIQREREALLEFKAALVDHHGMLSSWTTADCCQWEGIRCSNLTGHVLMLDLHAEYNYAYGNNVQYLSGRFISGEIHKSLMELQQLNYLDLNSNSFPDRGIPEFLGSLINLRYLDLSYCDIEGKIPTQFGSLSHLKYLNLAWNRNLEGSIPRQLGNLSQLQHLYLSANRFEGNIPSQIGNLSQLQHLDLSDNSLEGNIPSQIGNLSQLQHLDLSGNYFEGNIPSQIGKLSNLQKLYLGRYSDGGALKIDDGDHWPSNLISLTHLSLLSISNLNTSHSFLQMIAKLPNLRELSLYDCSLSDHFILSLKPSKFNFSTSLSIFDLSWNSFTSSMILQWLSNVTSNLVELDLSHNLLEGSTSSNHFGMVFNSLEHLDLSFNNFNGEVFKSFINVCTLHSLYMKNNNLSEDLPSILHNFSSGCVRHSLQELDLAYNQITGSLPDLSVFSSLKSLVLDSNQLSGKIPEGIGLPFHLESVSIQSNSLEGGIPKSFGNSCALSSLDMSRNNLNQELSVMIHHLSGCARYSLEQLYLGMNQINGTLPDLSIFSSLKLLNLDENKLNGEIPKDIKFPPQLEELVMQSNSLQGVLTDYHFANMSKLDFLELSDNSLLALTFSQNWVPPFQLSHIGLRSCKLGPEFPKWLQTQNQFGNIDISNAGIADMVPKWFWANLAFREWISMNISYNNLHGKIPSKIGKLASLESLDLSRNQLVGSIPLSLTQIYWLSVLDLSHNHLTGKIPTSTQLQSFNASSYEDNLDLCGPPLEKFCIDGRPTQKPNVEVQEGEYSLFSREFYISMTFGFVISFWVVFGSILLKRSWRHAYFKFLNNLSDNIYVKVAVFANKISKVHG